MSRRYGGTDFTDAEFSSRAALGQQFAQKQTKETKRNSAFVSVGPFRSKEMGDDGKPQGCERRTAAEEPFSGVPASQSGQNSG
jgi:hypothetical protein